MTQKITALDVDCDFHSKYLITGYGDSKVKLWEVETGKELYAWAPCKNRVNNVQWACGDQRFLAATPKALNLDMFVHIFRNPVHKDVIETNEGLNKLKIKIKKQRKKK